MKAVTILKMLVLGALVSLVSCNREIRIDDNLPAGNIIVEKVSGDTVYVKPDLRAYCISRCFRFCDMIFGLLK